MQEHCGYIQRSRGMSIYQRYMAAVSGQSLGTTEDSWLKEGDTKKSEKGSKREGNRGGAVRRRRRLEVRHPLPDIYFLPSAIVKR